MVLSVVVCIAHGIDFKFLNGGLAEYKLLFVGETIAFMAFGIAWLVKSRWLFGYAGQRHELLLEK
jgi:hypothetical protein